MNRNAIRFFCVLLCCALYLGCGSSRKHPSAPVTSDIPDVPEGRLPEGVRPLHYALDLTIVPERDDFHGTASITVELDQQANGVWLHGQDLRVSDVHATRDERRIAATWKQYTDTGVSRIDFAEPVPAGTFRLVITYEAAFGTQLKGLYRVRSAGSAYAFTQFEAISARLAFPSFDEPRFKTPFDVALTVPPEQIALANTPIDTAVRLPDGLQRVRYRTTKPLPTYLVAWAVGPLEVVAGEPIPPNAIRPHPIPFRGVAAKGQGGRLAYALEHTAGFVEFLENYFGIAYPYQKLDIVAVPDFAAGAMENVGLITFREWLLLLNPTQATEGQRRAFAYVMAHELAHQWFGNLVTMPWWNDIWLNEAFATWMGNKAVEALYPAYQADLSSLASAQRAMRFDSLPSARQIRQPIRSTHDIRNAFDAITYEKGGAVLGMFEQWMGADTFRTGIQLYLDRHQGGTATAADLLTALDEVDDRDVATPFRTFLMQPGVPLVRATMQCDQDGAEVEFSQQRYFPVGSSGDANQTWMIPLCLRDDRGTECTLLEGQATSLRIDRCPAWWMPNRDGDGYYRFSLEDADWSSLRKAGFGALSPRGRLATVDSLVAAFDHGTINAAQLLAWFPELVRSPIRQIADSPMRPLRFMINEAAPAPLRLNVAAWAGRLYTPLYRRLGWRSRRASEASDTKLLRRAVIEFMVMDVQDEAARRAAARLGDDYIDRLEGDDKAQRLDSELIATALATAVQERGARAFDRLVAVLDTSTDATTRHRIVLALGHAEDPNLSDRALALTLDPRLRSNEAPTILRAQFANPRTRERTWTWFKANFDQLTERLGRRFAGRSPWYTASFCSESAVDEVSAFFGPKVGSLSGAPRNLAGALESIALCAARVNAQRAGVIDYFGGD